jgi:hypothetical protein
MRLIGFTAAARSGKDSAANYLIDEHNFTRVAFADPIRQILHALNPIVVCFGLCDEAMKRVQDVVSCHGWDEAKVLYPEIRYLLQRLGTEAGRNILGPNVWVDLAMSQAKKYERVVITDCRFPNECQAIHDHGGTVIRITRPGVGPVNSHVSDQPLPDELIDFTIVNDGTLDDLAMKIESFSQLWA